MKVLITGAAGQLGRALLAAGPAGAGLDIWPTGRRELDLRDQPGTLSALKRFRPDLIINCAAYTGVDAAEREIGPAWAVNALGPAFLGAAAAGLGAKILHISTDYVFGRDYPGRPRREDDLPCPLNFYGRSKLAGERALLKTGGHLVLRTSWLYSQQPPNFPASILEQACSGRPLKAAVDQAGNPTSAHDLAEAIWLLAARLGQNGHWPRGLYHLAGAQAMSRFEWARSILDLAGLAQAPLQPVPSSVWPGRAARPVCSALDSGRAHKQLGLRLPAFKDSFPPLLAKPGSYFKSLPLKRALLL